MASLPNPLPQLAADLTGRSLGLDLPRGKVTDATIDGSWHTPLLWYAEEEAGPGDWLRFLPARRTAGLHPVLLGGDGTRGGRPEDWGLSPGPMSYPGDHDADDVLAEFWEEYAEASLTGADADYPGRDKVVELFGEPTPYDEIVAPFGADWPGLAEPLVTDTDPDTTAEEIADALTEGDATWLGTPRIALVPARRSADIPAAIGWTGPVNYENDVARLCSVLRSWEDRFGIRVVALTFDQLLVSVAAPPTTIREAEEIAAEHFAFCPDNITQGSYPTLREYAAKAVLNCHAWSFWWD